VWQHASKPQTKNNKPHITSALVYESISWNLMLTHTLDTWQIIVSDGANQVTYHRKSATQSHQMQCNTEPSSTNLQYERESEGKHSKKVNQIFTIAKNLKY